MNNHEFEKLKNTNFFLGKKKKKNLLMTGPAQNSLSLCRERLLLLFNFQQLAFTNVTDEIDGSIPSYQK